MLILMVSTGLYGQSHGPFTDDELNLIERKKNYGHPIVVGMNDGNYDGARAGQIKYMTLILLQVE